eukprot:TRINITY_DN16801_c0_g3_i1.p1 TRINITY_DN16801_c0_g3~~TRINITY_DN16801_c0_g3_i1.p1  ORF type:complete len:268 (+),score=28.50 TRINITY_DN16801_c0_g3_i1:90-893(+)
MAGKGGHGHGRSGHGPCLLERSLNHGLQRLPSGLHAFPVARNSEFHRSINQTLPELWTDFSERGQPGARGAFDGRSSAYHGDMSASKSGSGWSPAKSGQGVLFVGFAEFDMDGRVHTAGEMDRLMQMAASSKFPCARPATLDEYVDGEIQGLPQRNTSGRDVVFAGPGATGCELFHTNTLCAQKCAVHNGDQFDGVWGAATLHGRKCCICVYPMQRVKRQQSLTQFGLARGAIGGSGRMRRANSLAALSDSTRWTHGNLLSPTRGER